MFFLLLWLAPPTAVDSATARVTRIIDGDTVVVGDGRTVRYLGINAPEKGHPFAEAATHLNRKLVLGKEVWFTFDKKKKDGYGRTLAYIHVGEEMVNTRLLAEGMAHVFVIEGLSHYRDFLRIQREAKDHAKGIWGKRGFPGPLKITALHANAKGNDQANLNDEYLRICNISDDRVAFKDFSIEDHYAHQTGRSLDRRGSPHRYVFPEVSLEPGYTLLLLTGKGRDLIKGGKNLVLHWRSAWPIWNNDKDTAYLLDARGNVIDSFQYTGAPHNRK